MSVLLQHRVLRILWYLPVTSYFAPLWGPSLWWEYTLIFLILWPLPTLTSAYLLKIHIHATCSHSTAPCYTTLLWTPVGALCGCLCLMSWCVTVLGCLILFLHKFMSSWRWWAVSFVICAEPDPGLVVLNVCWMNVQTQSHWSKMFKKVWLYVFI